jgi:hypothetical protein
MVETKVSNSTSLKKVILVDLTKRDFQVTRSIIEISLRLRQFKIVTPMPLKPNAQKSKLLKTAIGITELAQILANCTSRCWYGSHVEETMVINFNNVYSIFDNILLICLRLLRIKSIVLVHVSRTQLKGLSAILLRYYYEQNQVWDLTREHNHPPVHIPKSELRLSNHILTGLIKYTNDSGFVLIPHGLHRRYMTSNNILLLEALASSYKIVVAGRRPKYWEQGYLSEIRFLGYYDYKELITCLALCSVTIFLCTGRETSGAMHTISALSSNSIVLASYAGSIPRMLKHIKYDDSSMVDIREFIDRNYTFVKGTKRPLIRLYELTKDYEDRYDAESEEWSNAFKRLLK